jgi:hypothetical protein
MPVAYAGAAPPGTCSPPGADGQPPDPLGILPGAGGEHDDQREPALALQHLGGPGRPDGLHDGHRVRRADAVARHPVGVDDDVEDRQPGDCWALEANGARQPVVQRGRIERERTEREGIGRRGQGHLEPARVAERQPVSPAPQDALLQVDRRLGEARTLALLLTGALRGKALLCILDRCEP